MSDTEKVYVISIRDGTRSFALQRLERAESMGIPCIKGAGRYCKQYERLNGKVVSIPVAEIQSITEYESVREYDESIEAATRVERNSQRRKTLFWIAYALFFLAVMMWTMHRSAK